MNLTNGQLCRKASLNAVNLKLKILFPCSWHCLRAYELFLKSPEYFELLKNQLFFSAFSPKMGRRILLR